MANPEKAVYEDLSDDNYIDPFDEEESESERGPIVIVIALITLAALLGVLWVGVKLGAREGASGPPILRAETAPAKSVPENRGGLEIPHTDKTVFDAINGKQAEEPEELLPPPEEPLILPETATAPEAPTVAEATGEDVGTDINVAEAQAALTDLIREQSGEPETPPANEAAGSTDVASAPPPAAIEPAEAPAAPQETASAAPTSNGARPLEFEKVPKAETNLATTTPAEQPPAAAMADPFFVQVTSVRTESDAQAAWGRLQGKFGSLVANYGPDIQTVDLGERGIYHRLRVGPLDGRDAASGLCGQFKQQGQDCIVVK